MKTNFHEGGGWGPPRYPYINAYIRTHMEKIYKETKTNSR